MITKDKTKNAFISIIKKALSHPDWCRRVIFASEQGASFPKSITTSDIGITFILEGGQNTFFYKDGQIQQQVIIPGKVFFSDVRCPAALDWLLPCKRLGMAMRDNWLGMAWKVNRTPEPDQVTSDLWFSTRHLERHPDMQMLFKALAARSSLPGNAELTRKLPLMIMHKMLEILSSDEPEIVSSSQHTYNKICDYLNENFHLPINRKTVAGLFGLNPDYVTRLFKEKGVTQFSEYLMELRLRHAEELLSEGELPIHEVARRCGIGDTSYFIKVFRKKHSFSPGEFKVHFLTAP